VPPADDLLDFFSKRNISPAAGVPPAVDMLDFFRKRSSPAAGVKKTFFSFLLKEESK
jgi:hypothetical protein